VLGRGVDPSFMIRLQPSSTAATGNTAAAAPLGACDEERNTSVSRLGSPVTWPWSGMLNLCSCWSGKWPGAGSDRVVLGHARERARGQSWPGGPGLADNPLKK